MAVQFLGVHDIEQHDLDGRHFMKLDRILLRGPGVTGRIHGYQQF